MTTDLAVVADRLTRAADLLDKLATDATQRQRWYRDSRSNQVWPGEGDCIEVDHPDNAAFIAAFDPYTVAALVEPMREAAEDIRLAILTYGSEEAAYAHAAPSDVVRGLDTFARRVLREEETP